MIAFVEGQIAEVTLSTAVVQVGGVGLELRCAPNTLAGLRPGQQAKLPTSMIVREDSLTLYGFTDEDEKSIFELVQTASGVGPKLAQAVIAVLSPDELRLAISSDDTKTLTKVPGIGLKGAQRIILELRDRIGAPRGSVPAGPDAVMPAAAWKEQVAQGLVGLGYSAKDADKAVAAVAESGQVGADPQVAQLLRAALRTLSKA